MVGSASGGEVGGAAVISWFVKRKEKVDFKRIECTDATEAIIEALENAGKMKLVLIIYDTKDDEEEEGGMIIQRGVTTASVNWLLDQAKRWLLF